MLFYSHIFLVIEVRVYENMGFKNCVRQQLQQVNKPTCIHKDTCVLLLLLIYFLQPEGETIHKNKAMFVDLRNQKMFEKNITLDIPKNVVSGSEHIEVSIIGKFNTNNIVLLFSVLNESY